MAGKTVLKISRRVTAYATFATLTVVLICIWGNFSMDQGDIMGRLFCTGIVVLLAAGVIYVLSKDLVLAEEKRVISPLAHASYTVSVVTTIIAAVILLCMTWNLLAESIVATKMLGSVISVLLAAVVIARISGISPNHLKRDSATI